MNACDVTVTRKSIEKYDGQLLVYLVAERKKKLPRSDEKIRSCVEQLHEIGDVKGKADEITVLYTERGKVPLKTGAKRILIVGIGEYKKETPLDMRAEQLRKAGGNISRQAGKVKSEELLVVFPSWIRDNDAYLAGCLTEGILLGNYRFDKYKKKQDEKEPYSGLNNAAVHAQGRAFRKEIAKAKRRCRAVAAARDMANEPGNRWTPDDFAAFAKDLARRSELECKVLGKNQLKKLGMGGILAVNQGTSTQPRLVILEHQPAKYSKTILMVGKGITFDSGGVSLKPAAGMQDMKYDMCGGAAVLSAMQAIADEKPGVRVIAIVPATDNMSGDSAVKPGDIITHYSGVTSEVVNTDAEGRLILADALAYGIENYKPDCVVDLATLTGAVIIGLGNHRAGLMSNSNNLSDVLTSAGECSGEKIWRLPLDKEYVDQIDSDVADIKNVGGKAAGSITAAAYLLKFVGDTPWAHLDIAGTAWDYTQKSYIPKGPSGFGVRLLLSFIDNWKQVKPDVEKAN